MSLLYHVNMYLEFLILACTIYVLASQNLLQQGEKITPKQWKAEMQSLQAEYDSISKEQSKTATELAYAEVISYNRKNLARELQNESRQQGEQQYKTKHREKEL